MSQSLYQSHNATTILYTPLTYAYNDSSTSWLATPNGHTSLFPNASFHIEWSGKGIHVNGTAGQGTLLASLDGAPFSDIAVNQGSGLVDYPSLGYGSHSLTVMNKPGGNMTVTSLALLGVEKFHEAKTQTERTIPATIKNSTGALIMNPQFMWDGDWVIDSPQHPSGIDKPRVLTSFAFNISDTSQVEVYGVGSSFTISANWREEKPGIARRSLDTTSTFSSSPALMRRTVEGEQIVWKKSLDRSASYYVDINVVADGGQWALSRVIVSDSIASSRKKLIIGITIPVIFLFLFLLYIFRCIHLRRKVQNRPKPPPVILQDTSPPSEHKDKDKLDSGTPVGSDSPPSPAPPVYEQHWKRDKDSVHES